MTKGSIPPIVRRVVVPTDPVDAFRIWVDEISAWWPFEGHSVWGTGSVAFTDGALVETSATGVTGSWGEILDWRPGALLRMTWHPGSDNDDATEVTVRFDEVDGCGAGRQTVVTLEHRGWERRADGSEARASYEEGWPNVLAAYVGATARDEPDDGVTWLVLSHTPGPALRDGETVFAHPDFGEHLAFLGRLAERGVLVAAGPLLPPTSAATGMTVIRVPDDEVETYSQLASTDDQSVVRGLLAVAVTTWAVRTP